jgi:hypothetical protein
VGPLRKNWPLIVTAVLVLGVVVRSGSLGAGLLNLLLAYLTYRVVIAVVVDLRRLWCLVARLSLRRRFRRESAATF